MKIVSIVGARPQFVKASAFSRELSKNHNEVLVHTGQHYDDELSYVFFEELEIPKPDYELGIGSGTHGQQTGVMLERLEDVLLNETPDAVIVFGDTNSTLAGALAASKLKLPVVHVEAGLRSYNRNMPEEINRVITDHLSSLLLCPGETAVENLAKEGIVEGVYIVGDIMLDVLAFIEERAQTSSNVLERLGLHEKKYLLLTVHREENTDNPEHLRGILEAVQSLNELVVFPIHPRTRKAVDSIGLRMDAGNLYVVDPVGYVDMVMLERSTRMILTDSGGIQKEAYWAGVPCITLRSETEWVETVQNGWNLIVGTDSKAIVEAVMRFCVPEQRPTLYGDGKTAARCVELLGEMRLPVKKKEDV